MMAKVPSPRLAVALVAIGLPGCSKGGDGAADAAVVARAQAAVAPFKAELRAELTAALGRSLESAVDVCAKRAPEIARAASHDGVTVGRSASRLRSPANAPRPWLAPALERLSRAPSGSEAHEVVALPGGGRGYAEAIWVGAPCLLCHGESVSPTVVERLTERYPADAARGFRVGDFRGVFWVELSPEALARRAEP